MRRIDFGALIHFGKGNELKFIPKILRNQNEVATDISRFGFHVSVMSQFILHSKKKYLKECIRKRWFQ